MSLFRPVNVFMLLCRQTRGRLALMRAAQAVSLAFVSNPAVAFRLLNLTASDVSTAAALRDVRGGESIVPRCVRAVDVTLIASIVSSGLTALRVHCDNTPLPNGWPLRGFSWHHARALTRHRATFIRMRAPIPSRPITVARSRAWDLDRAGKPEEAGKAASSAAAAVRSSTAARTRARRPITTIAEPKT